MTDRYTVENVLKEIQVLLDKDPELLDRLPEIDLTPGQLAAAGGADSIVRVMLSEPDMPVPSELDVATVLGFCLFRAILRRALQIHSRADIEIISADVRLSAQQMMQYMVDTHLEKMLDGYATLERVKHGGTTQ